MTHSDQHELDCTRLFLLGILSGGLLMTGCGTTPLPIPTLREASAPYSAILPASELDKIGVISLKKAQEIARLNNPSYRSTLHLVNAARMRYYQALGAYLPEISAQFTLGQTLVERGNIVNPLETTVDNNNVFAVHAGLKGTWLLFDGFARELEVLIRRQDEAYARANRANVLRLLDRSVAYAYCDLQLAAELQNIAQSDIVFQKSSLDQALARHGAGFIAKSDLLGFRIDLAHAQVKLIRANEAYKLARYVLSCLLGFPGGDLPDSVTVPPAPDAVPELVPGVDFFRDEALNTRPDLAMERALIAIRNYGKTQIISAFFPQVYAFGTLGYNGVGNQTYDKGQFLFRNYNEYSGSYGVSADWLLFNGFRRYNRYRELEQIYEEAKWNLAARQLTVMAEVESAYTVFQSNVEASRYWRDTLVWVFEQRNLVNVEYWAGHVTITRLRGAQTDLVTAQSNFASSVIEVYKAEAQLAAATGYQVVVEPTSLPKNTISLIFDHLEKQFGEE